MADGEDGGDGEAVEDHLPPLAVEPEGAAAGEVGEGRRLRQRDEPGGVEGHQAPPRTPRRTGVDGGQLTVRTGDASTHEHRW
jgi:hypothetical protein